MPHCIYIIVGSSQNQGQMNSADTSFLLSSHKEEEELLRLPRLSTRTCILYDQQIHHPSVVAQHGMHIM